MSLGVDELRRSELHFPTSMRKGIVRTNVSQGLMLNYEAEVELRYAP